MTVLFYNCIVLNHFLMSFVIFLHKVYPQNRSFFCQIDLRSILKEQRFLTQSDLQTAWIHFPLGLPFPLGFYSGFSAKLKTQQKLALSQKFTTPLKKHLKHIQGSLLHITKPQMTVFYGITE
ncbi:hypothetical protein [Bartonella sp. AP14QHHD]|uniref:hypothetical protein n=1 Tax=Bartonella sp. AP14QHHD TaxID=3243467 RepID=UPI0035CEB0D4